MSKVQHFKIFVDGAGYDAVAYEVTPIFFAIVTPKDEKLLFPWANVQYVRLEKRWLEAARKQEEQRLREEQSKIEVPPRGVIVPR